MSSVNVRRRFLGSRAPHLVYADTYGCKIADVKQIHMNDVMLMASV